MPFSLSVVKDNSTRLSPPRPSRGHENLRRYPESHRGIGNRRPMIPARCGHYPGPRNFSGQQVGERTARLERPGMLKKLKFEAEVGGSQTEVRRIDLYHRSPPNVWSDQPLCLGDRASINDVVGLDVHGSPLRTGLRNVFRQRQWITYCIVKPFGGGGWASSMKRSRS